MSPSFHRRSQDVSSAWRSVWSGSIEGMRVKLVEKRWNRCSLDRRRTRAMQPVANAAEDRQPLIDRGDLFSRKFPYHGPDPPLVDRSQLVDHCKELLRQAALAWRQRRLKPDV